MLGRHKKEIDLFFKKKESYNDLRLAKYLGIKEDKVRDILKWYARLEKGEQLYNYLKQKENDYCEFEVEL